MTKKRSEVRIQGLVRLMNRVRDQLRSGVPVDEAEAMRITVYDAVQAVERICRQRQMTPEELPTPSRRAYAYLRDLIRSGALEDAHLPAQESSASGARQTPPTNPIEVSGIVATCDYYHREFAALVAHSIVRNARIEQDKIARLASRLRTDTEAIKALCEESHGTPADLPAPSQRGYGWLRYLSDVDILARHLQTLKYFTLRAEKLLAQLPPTQPARTLQVHIYATAVLYRTRINGTVYQITLNEGFVDAPRGVIEALARATLDIKDAGKAGSSGADTEDPIKSYAQGAAFAKIHTALHSAMLAPTYHAMGQYHDLNLAFERVNTTYFEGQLERPHLRWNRTRTRRKYGHYDEARDTVMISQTLDAAGVPEYVIDFVVYHELLHKTLGTPVVEGRRRSHTSAFRTAERAFRRYAEARNFIAKLSSQREVEP
jgi:hypothetical protein